MSEEQAVRVRPAWEVRSLQAYCQDHGITHAEIAAAEAHAAQGNNNLYQSMGNGWLMGTGQPQTLDYVHRGVEVYGYPYERIPLIACVERYRAHQHATA